MNAAMATLAALAAFEFAPMTEADLDAVCAIEASSHATPWTRGNFSDSLRAGHRALLLRENGEIAAYAVLMALPDEVELLDITVAPARRQAGLGRYLLERVCAESAAQGARRMFLEVRASNRAARQLYAAAGFVEIGLRKGYYAGHEGNSNAREDAVLMARDLGALQT